MKISRIETIELTVPVEAPLRFAYGVHIAFTRTIVKIHTDEGLMGLGETAVEVSDKGRSLSERMERVGPADSGPDNDTRAV